jgi:hypothetical protein
MSLIVGSETRLGFRVQQLGNRDEGVLTNDHGLWDSDSLKVQI